MLKRFGGQWMAKWKVGWVWFGLVWCATGLIYLESGTGFKLGSAQIGFRLHTITCWPYSSCPILEGVSTELNFLREQTEIAFSLSPGIDNDHSAFHNTSIVSLLIFQAYDGDKFICMDSYNPKQCLVYSFGIRSNG